MKVLAEGLSFGEGPRWHDGALYFSVPPNGDSLAPVTNRLREDIMHLGATLRWP